MALLRGKTNNAIKLTIQISVCEIKIKLWINMPDDLFCLLCAFLCLNLMIARWNTASLSSLRLDQQWLRLAWQPHFQPPMSVTNPLSSPTPPFSNTFTSHWLTHKEFFCMSTPDKQKYLMCTASPASLVLTQTEKHTHTQNADRVWDWKTKKKIQSSLCFSEVYPVASLWAKDFNSTVTFKAALTVALFSH